ncbi:hypothetical protein CSB07_01580 [Candidatus Gracilibacteria bacterium]|nr:MAG: hypothetical protein CSB07_01580 [Candidatus Gracilibacteria bacterium]
MQEKILAKLQNNTFVKLFNTDSENFNVIKNIYSKPDLIDEKIFEFDPDKKLESDEWFFVEFTQEQKEKAITPFFSLFDSSVSGNNIEKEDYPDVTAIFLGKKDSREEEIFLTRIFPRFYTVKKTLITWNREAQLENKSASIDFNGILDAYWDGEKLYFQSYADIKPLFEGIEDFYRVATEEEKNDFLEKDFFESEDITKVKAGKRNLRKIAFILEQIDWDNQEIRKQYIDYAKQYPNVGVKLSETEDKMIIDNNKDLTGVLAILEERIYKTPITGVVKEAVSTINT